MSNKKMQQPKCPDCTSISLMVERRPNGDAKCCDCSWGGSYSDCFKSETKKRVELNPFIYVWDNQKVQQIEFFTEPPSDDYKPVSNLRLENGRLIGEVEGD